MKKIALITGILGQDGAYLAEFLLKKKYKVIGTSRNITENNKWRLRKLKIERKILFIELDICKSKKIEKIIKKYKVTEIYNFAAQSYVSKSFLYPVKTANVNALGVIKMLEAIRLTNPKIKFYQASSSEMFGNTGLRLQQEEYSYFNPQSPYAISKLFGHNITRNYRNSYNLFAVSGILFNHDSPLRGDDFIIKKIIVGLIKIILKKKKFIEVGNIYSRRDWGYAKEFVTQIWKMMQLKKPEDFIIATGKTHSIKEFINISTKYLKLDVKWVGYGKNEKLINKKNNKIIIKINSKFFRPSEINYSKGNINKATKNLKWKPNTTFKELVKLMIDDELKKFSKYEK